MLYLFMVLFIASVVMSFALGLLAFIFSSTSFLLVFAIFSTFMAVYTTIKWINK